MALLNWKRWKDGKRHSVVKRQYFGQLQICQHSNWMVANASIRPAEVMACFLKLKGVLTIPLTAVLTDEVISSQLEETSLF